MLIIGAAGDSTKTTSGTKTEFKDSKNNKLVVVELLGANVKFGMSNRMKRLNTS